MNEIQEVYRLQGVNINDKAPQRAQSARWGPRPHIEVITGQMMRWVRIEDVGDTGAPSAAAALGWGTEFLIARTAPVSRQPNSFAHCRSACPSGRLK